MKIESCFLNLNKPAGITSRAAVDQIVKVVGDKRVGHAGTLDPLATGVLVVGIAKATRLVEYVQRMPKIYSAEFLLGRTSDTDDVQGEVELREGAIAPGREEVAAALTTFIGRIEQRPPNYSAVKLAGRRAYELARKGKQVVLAPRPVEIHGIELLHYDFPQMSLRIHCGSGTYIRSIARDLGERLGVGGVMSRLERTAIGAFTVESAVSPSDLTAENWRQHILPLAAALVDLPRVEADEAQRRAFLLGGPFAYTAEKRRGAGAEVAVVAAEDGAFLGVGLWDPKPGRIRPSKGGFAS